MEGCIGRGSQLRTAVIIPTWRCNGGCEYCDYRYAADIHGGQLDAFGKEARVGHELTVDEWVRTLKMLGVEFVEITGGEPTLRQDFPEVLKQLGVKWAITSNTTLNVNPWLGMGIIDKCAGWAASLHEWTNRGQFKANVNSLLAYRAPVKITVVLQKNNLSWSKKAVSWAKGQGWYVIAHPEYDEGQSWSDTDRQAAELVNADEVIDLWEWPKPELMNCKAGATYWAVGPDGRMYNCYFQMLFRETASPPLCMSGCPFPCDKRYAQAVVER